ncbi:MAG: glucoamylase family protein [Pirellulales bacterium]
MRFGRNFLSVAALIVFFALATQFAVAAVPVYEQHVIFDNSATDDSYFHSQGSVIAPSEFELSQDKCPVASNQFVSPPNSLRLKWTSNSGGDWRITIQRPGRIGAALPLAGDTLSLWCFADEEIAEEHSPLLMVFDERGNMLPDSRLLAGLGKLPAKTWTRINVPLGKVQGRFLDTSEKQFDPRRISRITLTQGLDDGREHVLYLDDVRLVDSEQAAGAPPSAPTNISATGAERHVDISWTPAADDDVLSYRIYRSADGQHFSPLGTQPGYLHRYVDFVGAPDKQFMYKVSAIDVENRESPLSAPASASTQPLSDDALLDMVQQGCFRYYWDGANRESGMALEVLPGDDDLVALGGSGFGIMALVVATERQFVPREEAVDRMLKIVRFLDKADRFHGVWPHFLHGSTGKVWPLFGKYDNGGDLVETAFLMQGLLTARQYFGADSPKEREIRETVTRMWRDVEWDWYRKTPDGEVLYWHWSPSHEWHISHPLIGFNETMIVYLLAVASPTHAVPASMYYSGWAGQSARAIDYRQGWSRTTQGDHYANGHEYYGQKLDVGCGTGGDLFFAQFSYLGFDPRNKRDKFTNYFHNNRQLALINRAYCVDNPRGFKGYGPDCWGLSAGIRNGGGKPQPRSDNGTICSSAALGCMPYSPDESLAVLRHLYRDLGDRVWGVYGFHDGFNESENWFDECYMGLNQAQIVVGIENYRTGLPWKLFMSNPEVRPMLDAIGFEPDNSPGVAVSLKNSDSKVQD